MKKIIISTLAVSALLMNTACNTDFDQDVKNIKVTNGSADFSNYVALGNSLTSGYRDGALYQDGQLESYPNMIAEQMKLAGGGDFTQPLMPDNIGGFSNFGVRGKLTLQVVNGSLTPVPTPAETPFDRLTGSYNNMGVPGAKSFHLVTPGFGSSAGNPYFARFASSPTTTVMADFVAKKPTFFSLWIGNNDALLYALEGADDNAETLTPVANFKAAYDKIEADLKKTNAKGVVANIPDVTTVPVFTTVPYNPLTTPLLGRGDVATGEATIDFLNTRVYGPLKQILTALKQGDRIQLLSTTNSNPLLIKDENLTDLSTQITAIASQNPQLAPFASLLGRIYGQARHAKSGDLIPLTTRNVIGTLENLNLPAPYNQLGAKGIAYPLEDKYVLTETEVKLVSETTASYNQIIKDLADRNGWAFVDANAKMVELSKASGIQWDGVKYNARFVTGGAFSLDGVHLTGRGYGIIANEFIKAINEKYGSTLPQVNPNKYSGIKFP